jgi:hypothetical protein
MLDSISRSEATEFFQEIKELFADTNRQFKETDRQFKETREQFQETDRKFQATDKKFQETDRQIKELKKVIGQLGGRLGDFVEEMVRPAVLRLFLDRGLNVHQVFQNVTKYDDQRRFIMEIDLLAVNSDTAVAIECKSHCSVEDVKEHLERLAMFKPQFPQYAGFQIHGAVAAMVMPDDVARYAYRQGLFVLAQSGDSILIRNDPAFQPKAW